MALLNWAKSMAVASKNGKTEILMKVALKMI